MLCRLLACVLVMICTIGSAVAEDVDNLISELESSDARNAIRTYKSAVSRTQDDFRTRVAMARKKLVAELEVAQAKATKANLLDEAVRIRDIKRAYKSDTIPALPMTEIIIIAALYGQNISWLDVTDKVRRAVNGKSQWSGTVATKDWGEPAPGFGGPRTLMIRYSVAGKVRFRAAYQGEAISIP
jgi:hypothetical protein